MLRLRSVSISVLDIRDFRTSSLRIDSSTSGATLKLVSGGWSGWFAKSMLTSVLLCGFLLEPVWYENLSGVVSCPENSNINTDGLDSVVIGSRDQ